MTLAPPRQGLGSLFSADGWLVFIGATLSRLYLGICLSLAIIAVLPALLGWNGSVVQSGSMEPHISAGDVVLSSDFGDENPVPVGGVVEFTSPASAQPSGEERTILHRIVDVNADGTFVTAGDANEDVDSAPLTRDQITGQARILVPMIGLPAFWLDKGNVAPVLLWAVATLLAVFAAVYGIRPEAAQPASVRTSSTDGSTGRTGSGRPQHLAPKRRRWKLRAVVAVVVVLALLFLGMQGFSAAAFTSTTANQQNTFSTASDWAEPSVTMVAPSSPVKDTVTVTAEAADAESGIRDVVIQYLPANGSSWATLCADTSAPYSCQWNTRAVADGHYSLRAIATDNAGHTTTSDAVETTVANNLLVVLANPGETVRGTTNLATSLYNTGSTAYTVRVEYAVAGTTKWTSICTNLRSPYGCTWNTAGVANDFYDLRAVATAGTTTTYSALVTDVQVDNTAPAVTMTDPGTPLSGSRTFTATATDADSGIAQVVIQYQRTGSTTWTPLCTVADAPYSCRFDTTTLADGSYSFRAVATDVAGNTTTSAATAGRVVDNTVSSISMEDPGAYLSGTVPLRATANSTGGISSVRIQSAPAGTSTWTTRCTLAAAPYGCNFDTRTVADGLYDFRAILTETSGKEIISAVVVSRRVDNSPLRGTDIQATNGSAIAGRPEAGDSLSFTYSQQINPATVSPGWTGAPLAVTLRLSDGNLLGTGNNGDTVDILRQNSTVNLGSVNLRQNFAKPRRTVTFNATMSANTVTVGGIPRTVITVTLGSIASGGNGLRTVSTPATMVWNPSAAVTNLSGNPSSTSPVNETGISDRDF